MPVGLGVPLPSSLDARPCNRKAIGFQSHFFHQCDILLEFVKMIAGNVSGIAIQDLSWRLAEYIPYGGTLCLLIAIPLLFDRKK